MAGPGDTILNVGINKLHICGWIVFIDWYLKCQFLLQMCASFRVTVNDDLPQKE